MPLTSHSLSTETATQRILVRCLFLHALTHPEETALHDPASGNIVDWRTLAGKVLQMAERLCAIGARAGQCVAVAVSNRSDSPIVSLAIQQLGAVEVALGTGLSEDDLLSRVAYVQATVLVVDSGKTASRARCQRNGLGNGSMSVVTLADLRSAAVRSVSTAALDAALHATERLDPEATALVLWTSGTQSSPRGAMLSHQALASNAAGKLQAVPQSAQDRRLTVLPLAHAYARTCDMGTWLLSGGSLAVALGWEGLLKTAPVVQPTLINLVPSLALKLLRRLQSAPDPGDALAELGLAHLRLLGCGGAPLAADDFLEFRKLGILVIHGYGLTEAGPVVCSATPENAAPGVVGRPIADVRIRIDRDQRLWVRGPGLMKGYWGDPSGSAQKCVDGWLDTGDLASRDRDGLVTILGRADDTLVLANGRKLQPFAFERACCRLSEIRNAILCVDAGRLVLLLDSEPTPSLSDELAAVFASFPSWQRPERVVRLPRALSYEQNELTAKGTVRRGQVIERWRGYRP